MALQQNHDNEHIACLMDLKQKKVGCVLLQAAYGGSTYLPMQIDTKHWFLAPTPDMILYNIPAKELPEIIKAFNAIGKIPPDNGL